MKEQAKNPGPGRLTAGFLLEAFTLFVVLAAPYLILHAAEGILIAGALALCYLIWAFAEAVRRSPESSPSGLKATGFATLHLIGGTLAVGGFVTLLVLGWIHWAYRVTDADGNAEQMWNLLPAGPLVSISVAAVLASAAVLVASLAPLRRDAEKFGDFYRRIWASGSRTTFFPSLAALTLGLVVAGLLNVGGALISMSVLLENMAPHRTVPGWVAVWEVAAVYPVIPIGLFAVAAMLAAHRRMIPAIFAHIDSRQIHVRHAERFATRLATLGGAAVTLGAITYFVHLGTVAGLGTVAELGPSVAVIEELEAWVAAQRADGRTNIEIAAALEENGRWTPDTPDAGLIVLLPKLDTDPMSIRDSACRYRVAVGVADTAELEGFEWLAAEQATLDVRYCLAISCPNPVVWDTEPRLMLYSSHASRNLYWQENLFMNPFGEGVAEPGGYCTAEGDLADSFQG